MLIIVLCVAIFTFSSLGSVKEGYKNKHRCSRCHDDHDDNECPYMKNKMDNTSMLDNMNGSYIAPAGNTVLFGIDMPDSMSDTEQHKKNNHKNKKKHKEPQEPQAISSSQIPEGEEDLYILKSEVVPPVCPACPNVTVCPNNNNKPPPPCPPCARCPEPAFECKKVPNYNSNSSNNVDYLPRPVLTDFSNFGM
jgi:hypothetical protein